MSECLISQLSRNRTGQLLKGCGGKKLDVYTEINGPRPMRYHPHTGQQGHLQDDGSFDFTGPGKRIFFPQHFRIDDLHESYPNATWILNWRDPNAWVESVMKWGDDLHHQFLNEYYMQGAIPHIPTNVTIVKELLKRLYVDHHDMVRDFVARHPSHALIEVNIEGNNTGRDLANAFGLNEYAWMNINQNRKPKGDWQAHRISTIFDGIWDLVESARRWWILMAMGTLTYFCWSSRRRRI